MWNRWPKPVKLLISKLIYPLLLLAIGGIVGNRSDWAFLKGLSLFTQTVNVTVPWWAIFLFFLLPTLLVSIPLLLALLHYFGAHRAAIKLVKLDDTLLRLLTSSELKANTAQATTRLFEEFFEDTLDLFSDGCRISIFLPDPNDPDYLKIFYSLGVPQETINRTKFYIGSNNGERGIAGRVYLEKSIRVVHLSWGNNQWKFDDPSYKVFSERKNRVSMPYQAIVAIPIIDNTNPSRCIGVLCLDSKDPKAFDKNKIKEGLTSVAARISAIFLILENYKKRELVPILIRLLSSLSIPRNRFR